MRLLVCGDRNWSDSAAIMGVLQDLKPAVVIHGAARGADSIAGVAAIQLGIPVEVYPAQWDKYGRAAGPKRNRQMLDEGKPTHVVAFHDNLALSKGTKNMVAQAERAGLDVVVYGHNK